MENMMTHLQQKTIYEMMRQGLHSQIYIAEHSWSENKKYEIGMNVSVPLSIMDLIKKSNYEIEHSLH